MSANPPPDGFQRLAASGAVASLVLVAVGGAVRATDSGLACPTWPGCFSSGDFLPPADLHVWLEHSHRLLAGVVGLMIATLTAWAVLRHRHRAGLLWPTVAAAVLVNVQALLGAFVVWRLLRAELVTAHLGLAMLITACLIAVAVNAAPPSARAGPAPGRAGRLGRLSAAVTGLAFVQILVGGHVTGIGAGLAYRLEGFPLMDGAVFPAVGEATQRQLYHASHRVLAVALAVAIAWLWWQAAQDQRGGTEGGSQPGDPWLVRLPALATALVVVQVGVGIANVWSGLSWLAVIPHLAVASWIWAVLFLHVMLTHRAARLRAAPAAPLGDRPHAEVGA